MSTPNILHESVPIGKDENDNPGGDETLTPDTHNGGGGGEVKPGPKTGEGTPNPEGKIIVKPTELRGMNYRFFCINKKESKYVISFISDFTEENVTLQLDSVDESGTKEPVKIFKCESEMKELEIDDNLQVRLSIKKGEKVKLVLTTDQKDLFSGEVRVYAYR